MKAAIYARCSTETQATEGFSISAQLTEVQEYCVKNNIEVHEFYSDEGISGTKEDRPAFQKMIHDAEKKLFDVILVHKFDRFARRVEISQRIKSRLKKASVNVISITEPIEDSPIGFFQEGLLELLSEYYIKNLSNEIKKGKKERASQGFSSGPIPFGYRTNNGNVYIVEKEAAAVRTIFDLYLQGYGYGKISSHLNSANILTVKGNKWEHSTIRRLINNPIYAGYIRFSGQLYESQIPQIISKETFEVVHRDKGVKGVKYVYRTNRQNLYLFHGLLKCGECGWNMRVQYSGVGKYKGRYKSYVCNNAGRFHEACSCDFSSSFNVQKLEKKIIEEIYKDSLDSGRKINTKNVNLIVDIVDNYKDKINKELKRAKDAYIAGVFDLGEYSQLRIKLEKELGEIKESPPIQENDSKEKLKSVMKEFELIPEEDIITRKRLLKSIIESISISRSGISITYL